MNEANKIIAYFMRKMELDDYIVLSKRELEFYVQYRFRKKGKYRAGFEKSSTVHRNLGIDK